MPSIDLITYGYPLNPTDLDKLHYYEYIMAMQYVLPCSKCRKHMAEYLKKYPLTSEVLANRDSLVKWGIDFHNVVNNRTGKPMLTYDQAMAQIKSLMAPTKFKFDWKYFLIILLVIAICIIIYLVMKCKKN